MVNLTYRRTDNLLQYYMIHFPRQFLFFPRGGDNISSSLVRSFLFWLSVGCLFVVHKSVVMFLLERLNRVINEQDDIKQR